ncbi:MAG TPA: cupin domain-containing protein [Steroidobacteraceae bacterium]|nr:cupin domain-containing protein [Steroidobacteraceae bacterium]
MSTAQRLIEQLGLAPHPEGGWYRQIHRSALTVQAPGGERAALTTIYYLLERDQVSRWHVVDADEAWHFYAGAPLELCIYYPRTQQLSRRELGSPADGRDSVAVVAADAWQAARSTGEYSLVGCTVGPGFEYSGFRFVSDLSDHRRHFEGVLHPLAHLL